MGSGSGMSFWRRLCDWQAVGVWAALHRALLERLEGAGQLDWHRAALDCRRERRIMPRIARRGIERSQRLGRHRWVVV
jgi:hypothetical protein